MVDALGKEMAYSRLASLSMDADAGVLSAVLSPEELCRDASPAPSEAAEAAAAEEDWTRTLERWSTPPHAVKQTLENHLIIMRNEPFYRNLRFNRLSRRGTIPMMPKASISLKSTSASTVRKSIPRHWIFICTSMSTIPCLIW